MVEPQRAVHGGFALRADRQGLVKDPSPSKRSMTGPPGAGRLFRLFWASSGNLMNQTGGGWLTPFVVEILLVSDEQAYGRSIIAPGRANRGDTKFARGLAGNCPTISKRPL